MANLTKLRMPEPFVPSVSPESSLFNASDDFRTLAKAHEVMKNPSRLKGLSVHIEKVGNTLKSLKSSRVRARGVKR